MHSTNPLGRGGSLRLRALTKHYPNFTAVDAIDLDIAAGEFVTLLGPSGSGKTTTLMMIAGFTPPSAGDILLDGRSLVSLAPEHRNIGVVFQNYALFPHMNVQENVAFPLRMRNQSRRVIGDKVAAALHLVQLDQFAERLPKQLSGGQQQRVALARALVFDPDLLLMDEPLGALDKNLREQMQFELRRLHAELSITILFVTHDQEEALTLSDRVALMNNGEIAQIGSAEDLYERPATRFVAEFIGESNVIEGRVDGEWFVANGGTRLPCPQEGPRSATLMVGTAGKILAGAARRRELASGYHRRRGLRWRLHAISDRDRRRTTDHRQGTEPSRDGPSARRAASWAAARSSRRTATDAVNQ